MQCIKTGCEVFLMSRGEYLRGDAFLAPSGDLVIRTVYKTSREPMSSRRHFTIMEEDHWFEDEPFGTMIVAKGMFNDHGYDGIEEPKKAASTA